MRRTVRKISTVVYGLGIVGALAFGANQALGRPVYASCIYHFPILGACTSTGNPVQDSINCKMSCDAYGGGPYTHSYCRQGDNCCVCRS